MRTWLAALFAADKGSERGEGGGMSNIIFPHGDIRRASPEEMSAIGEVFLSLETCVLISDSGEAKGGQSEEELNIIHSLSSSSYRKLTSHVFLPPPLIRRQSSEREGRRLGEINGLVSSSISLSMPPQRIYCGSQRAARKKLIKKRVVNDSATFSQY